MILVHIIFGMLLSWLCTRLDKIIQDRNLACTVNFCFTISMYELYLYLDIQTVDISAAMLLNFLFWACVISFDRYIRRHIGRFEFASTVNATMLSIGGVCLTVKMMCGADITQDVESIKWLPVGYYFIDLWTATWDLKAHHVVVFIMILYTPTVPVLCCALLLMEIPVIFINVGLWFMHELPERFTVNFVNVTMASYVMTRSIIFPIALICTLGELGYTAYAYVTLYCMNWYWFILLARKANIYSYW